MSLEKIVAEAMAGRPLEMKEAFAEEIDSRIQDRLEEKFMEVMEAKKAEDDQDGEDDKKDDEDEEDEDEEDEDEDMDESFDLSVEGLEEFIVSEEFDSLNEETQNTIMYHYEGSIKGSGTDRKAQLKKAYRAGEQKTRDFYDNKLTKDPKTSDKGMKKAVDAGKNAGDGNPTAKGAARSKSQDSLKGSGHDQSDVTPTSKSFRSTHRSKMYSIKKAAQKRG